MRRKPKPGFWLVARRECRWLLHDRAALILIFGVPLFAFVVAFVQGIRRLIEPGNRGVAVLGQLADAIIGLLRQDDARLRALQRGLARCDGFHARTDIDVGELRIGHDLGSHRLLVLRDGLGVVDAHQHRSGRDVLPAHDRDLRDASVNARRDVEPRGVHLSLHQQRLWPNQIPDRQGGNDGDHSADDDGCNARRRSRPLLWNLLRCFRRRLGDCGCLNVGIGHLHPTLR